MNKPKQLDPKKNLNPQLFIYLAATDKQFRTKYFRNPKALKDDYAINDSDWDAINSIDFQSLRKELSNIEAGLLSDKRLRADSCHDSHNSHGSGDHSSGNHSNSCKGMLNIFLQREFLKAVK